MAIKYPLEYELNPRSIDTGRHWVTLSLRNIGTQDLTGLDVSLNSLDAYSISVLGTGSYMAILERNDQREIPFQVSANRTGSLYVTVDGWKDGERFHWESPGIPVTVGAEVAELESLFAMTEPYPSPGEALRCQAMVRGLKPAGGLHLEFWAQQPNGVFKELGTLENLQVSAGDENTYATEITPERDSPYVVHAYLYEGERGSPPRIGHATDKVYVGPVETPPLQRPELPPRA